MRASTIGVLTCGVVVSGAIAVLGAAQQRGGAPAAPTGDAASAAVAIDADDIGGVVRSMAGPEPACGSSPKRPIFRPSSAGLSSPTTRAAT